MVDFLDTVTDGIENAVGAVLAPVADTAGAAAAALRREITQTWQGVFGSPTPPGGTNWNAYSHEELYAMVHTGADPGQVGEQSAVLDGLGRGAYDCADELAARRGQVAEVWEGQAYGAFGSTLDEHSAGGTAVADHAATLSAAVARASEALSRAQAAMPEPVDVGAATSYGALAGGAGPNFALGSVSGAGASWFGASLLAANKKAEAVEVMQAFEQTLTAADPPETPAKVPPAVPGGVPLPAPRPESPGVAAVAIPRPATPGRATRATAPGPATSSAPAPGQAAGAATFSPATPASATPASATPGALAPGQAAEPATFSPATPGPATPGPATPGPATPGAPTPGQAAEPASLSPATSASATSGASAPGQAATPATSSSATPSSATSGPAVPGAPAPSQAARPTTFSPATSSPANPGSTQPASSARLPGRTGPSSPPPAGRGSRSDGRSGWASGPDGRAGGRPVAWRDLVGRGGVPGLLTDAERPARTAAPGAVPANSARRDDEDRDHHNRMPRSDRLFTLDDKTPPPVIGA